MPKPLRKAAALFLCLQSEKPSDSNIIMIKRLGTMAFGNLYAAPGGVCDPQDIEASQSKQFIDYGKVTCLRQFLEQTNLLIYPADFESLHLLNEASIDDIVKMLPKIWAGKFNLINPLIRLITPQMVPSKRFDCFFYLISLSPEVKCINLGIIKNKNSPIETFVNNFSTIALNTKQSSGYLIESPKKMIARSKNKDPNFVLAPPQILILSSLMKMPGFPQIKKLKNIEEPIMFQPLNHPKFFPIAMYGDSEYNCETIIRNEPQSESKQELIKYWAKSQQAMIKSRKRRIMGPSVAECSQQETGLFQFLSLTQSKL